ncbi:MAG: hypothetical protein ABEH58_04600 [Haloplanus sp.]
MTGFDGDRVVVVWWADRADRPVLTVDPAAGRPDGNPVIDPKAPLG